MMLPGLVDHANVGMIGGADVRVDKRTALTAADNAVVTDTSVGTTPEIVKTINITPGPDEYVLITAIDGEVSLNSLTGGVVRTAELRCGITVNLVQAEATVVLATQTFNAGTTGLGCSGTTLWQNGTRTVAFAGPVGVPVGVNFLLSTNNTTLVSAYCTRNNSVTYTLVKVGRLAHS